MAESEFEEMYFVESNNSQHVDVSSRRPESKVQEQEVEDPEVLAMSFTMYKIGEKNWFQNDLLFTISIT